jgi:signal transduction histidine kinase
VAVQDQANNVVFKTRDYKNAINGIDLPVFTQDIVFQGYSLHLYFPSTISYILKKSISVIVLSLFVTLLLVTIIILLYRRMLTEQKLNQYKNDFINNLTHELKTPLATISLANANIRSSADYSGQGNIKQYTHIIDEENKKLNTHIEKVFELSLLEKEKQIFHTERCNIHQLINQAIHQNKPAIQSKQAEIQVNLEAKDHFAIVDSFHFVNALSNMIDNALKYSDAKPLIQIKTYSQGDRLFISLKDNGIGISKEDQRLIFDKFFRVTHNNLHTTKGFGIGLSYAKQAIEIFGGSLLVNSELNKGSEFVIIIPNAKN